MPLIVLEGLDGAGKSTQVTLLREWLGRAGGRSEFIHFPRYGASEHGERIAAFLRGEMGDVDTVDPLEVAELFAADRADAAPVIRGWLAEGVWVVLDRYVESNVAYQCAKIADPVRREEVRRAIVEREYTVNALPRPDLALFIDVPMEFVASNLRAQRTGRERDYLNGGEDIHEASCDFQRRVREEYLRSVGDGRLTRVDCSDLKGSMLPVGEVAEKIRNAVSAVEKSN